MINISVSLADATVTGKETLTAGRVGLQCQLSFSADWNDLQKIVVCEGAETREVPLTGDTITVPPECMATAGYRLRIGVMGISASEEIVIPTVWAKVGKILESADVGGDIYPEATPSVVAQIMENSATALELAQDVANAAARGDFNGAPGADGANATIVGATGSVDDQVGTPSVEVTVGGSDTERTFDFAFHNMKGEKGDTGDKGDTGNTGAAATVAVGTTTTGDAGTNAAVTNSGTSSAAVLNFTIPKGDKGDKGDTGNTGATPAFSVGTVTTGAAGSSAAATISGTAAAPVLNLTIPQGLKGDAGNGDMVADDFSTSNAYAVGDYVIYSGSLYRFTTAHAAGAWNASHATAVQLAEDVGELKSAVEAEQAKYISNDVSYTCVSTHDWIDLAGLIHEGSAGTNSLIIDVEPNSIYYLWFPYYNRQIIGETSDDFVAGQSYTVLAQNTPYDYRGKSVRRIATGNNARKLIWYFYSGDLDSATVKDDLIASKSFWSIDKAKYLNPVYYRDRELYNGTALIFGDSITETCYITVNDNDETTSYGWRIPNNSYNPGSGVISYSMWPQILRDNQSMLEVRNYALSGASYKTQQRAAGEERKNVQKQIDIAINDKNNPNGVFSVDNFSPNIVVFALGVNDGAFADSYEIAMQATVYENDGITINVPATINALDDTKSVSSARKAILRIRQSFPMSQIFCVLPLQTAGSDNLQIEHDELKKLFNRSGCIVIDGAAESGITREFETKDGLGLFLKDGLHPNEKGQNMLARLIISKIKANFIPYLDGFNIV